jgi:hypothetical protein
LNAEDANDRIAEWRKLFASEVADGVANGSVARLRLRSGDDVLLRVVDLAEREQACCPFFRFKVELLAGVRWLQVSVPDDAGDVLGEFISLLGGPPATEPSAPSPQS